MSKTKKKNKMSQGIEPMSDITSKMNGKFKKKPLKKKNKSK